MIDINLDGRCTCKGKQSEVEVGIVNNNINKFILAYGTPLLNGGTLRKYLVTLSDTSLAYKVLPR